LFTIRNRPGHKSEFMGKVIALYAEDEMPQNFSVENFVYEPFVVIFNDKKFQKKPSSKNHPEEPDRLKKKEKTKKRRN
jgi:hypothetical protein